MNDDGGTLSDLWREERDACMLGRGVREGWVIREGLLGSVFFYQRGEQRGDAATARSPITGRHREAEFTVTASGGKIKGGQRESTGIQKLNESRAVKHESGCGVCSAWCAVCVAVPNPECSPSCPQLPFLASDSQ